MVTIAFPNNEARLMLHALEFYERHIRDIAPDANWSAEAQSNLTQAQKLIPKLVSRVQDRIPLEDSALSDTLQEDVK